jgi:hypothetical protein
LLKPRERAGAAFDVQGSSHSAMKGRGCPIEMIGITAPARHSQAG